MVKLGRRERLPRVDLDFEEATVFGLLGPSGAGKTTFVWRRATLVGRDAGTAEAVDARGRASELLERCATSA